MKNKKLNISFDFVNPDLEFKSSTQLLSLEIFEKHIRGNNFLITFFNIKNIVGLITTSALILFLVMVNSNEMVIAKISSSKVPFLSDYALSREIDLVMADLDNFEVNL